MCRYDHDYSLLINAGLSHDTATSIAESVHWDRVKAEYDALREARRSGDTVRADLLYIQQVGRFKRNINAQYGKFTPFYNLEIAASVTETAQNVLAKIVDLDEKEVREITREDRKRK